MSGRPELLAVARDAWGAVRLPREGAVALARHGGHDVLVQLGPLITVVVREDPDHVVLRRADLRGRAGVGLTDQRTGVGRRIGVLAPSGRFSKQDLERPCDKAVRQRLDQMMSQFGNEPVEYRLGARLQASPLPDLGHPP